MIIWSDGIWEFISSQECVDITSLYYEKNDLKGCCQYLYAEWSMRWLKKEEVIDDITLILVFFEYHRNFKKGIFTIFNDLLNY